MFSAVEVEDLSQAVPGREGIDRQHARIAAARGIDVLTCTPACWTVCSLCNLPTIAFGGMSVCHYGPVRVQGWAK